MNTQKGFASILIFLLGLIVVGGGIYLFLDSYTKAEEEIQAEIQKYSNSYEFFQNELNSSEYTYRNNLLGIEFNYPKYLDIRGPNDNGDINVFFFYKAGNIESISFDVTLNSNFENEINHLKNTYSSLGRVDIQEINIANTKAYRAVFTAFVDAQGDKLQYVHYMVMNNNVIHHLSYQFKSKEDILLSKNLPVVQKIIESVKFSDKPLTP